MCMAYNCPGWLGTVPPLTKLPCGVGALLLGLPRHETVPAAPLIGAPLLNYTKKAKGGEPIRGAKGGEGETRR